jgi:hypothetical protein
MVTLAFFAGLSIIILLTAALASFLFKNSLTLISLINSAG